MSEYVQCSHCELWACMYGRFAVIGWFFSVQHWTYKLKWKWMQTHRQTQFEFCLCSHKYRYAEPCASGRVVWACCPQWFYGWIECEPHQLAGMFVLLLLKYINRCNEIKFIVAFNINHWMRARENEREPENECCYNVWSVHWMFNILAHKSVMIEASNSHTRLGSAVASWLELRERARDTAKQSQI